MQSALPPANEDVSGKLIQTRMLDVRIDCSEVFPSNDVGDYEISRLQELKDELNTTKKKMDEYYIDKEMFSKFNAVNNVLRLTKQLRWFVDSKMNGQLVTRAWLKFYELFYYYKLIPEDNPEVSAFMNAELPGAAICALNHMMKTLYKNKKFDWCASSIVFGKDDKERLNGLGDHYGIWKKNRTQWLMSVVSGNTNVSSRAKPGSAMYIQNGDATVVDNLLDIEMRIGESVDLYTHDAGIDVGTPEEGSKDLTGFHQQEMRNAKIHFGCAIAGFLTLKKGGNFVAKQYTFFEGFTLTLLFVYASMFEEFYLSKPMTSGQANSEIYLVGKGFKGFKHRDILLKRLENFNTKPFLTVEEMNNLKAGERDVGVANARAASAVAARSALDKVVEFTEELNKQQIEYIEEVFKFYKSYGTKIGEIKRIISPALKKMTEQWVEKHEIKKIDKTEWLDATKSF